MPIINLLNNSTQNPIVLSLHSYNILSLSLIEAHNKAH